jgi:hypothetical protein
MGRMMKQAPAYESKLERCKKIKAFHKSHIMPYPLSSFPKPYLVLLTSCLVGAGGIGSDVIPKPALPR